MTETSTRLVTINIPAIQLEPGDILHGLPVYDIQPANEDNSVVRIKAYDGEAGVDMHISANQPVIITRTVPVGDNECVVCGRPRKYKDLCAAHYAAKRRAARSVPGPGQNSMDVPLPFENEIFRRNADRQADY